MVPRFLILAGATLFVTGCTATTNSVAHKEESRADLRESNKVISNSTSVGERVTEATSNPIPVGERVVEVEESPCNGGYKTPFKIRWCTWHLSDGGLGERVWLMQIVDEKTSLLSEGHTTWYVCLDPVAESWVSEYMATLEKR